MKSPWPTKKLGEICEENIKSPFKVEDATNSGEYPFFTSGESVLTHDEYLVDGENIFLATGGYANVKYYNGKASYSADTWSLKVKNALTKFVFYQILAKLKYIDEVLFRGSGLRHLQKKEFLNLEIPLPPLPIQQKIVKILDTIQSAIDIHDKIIEKTKELKRSLMNLLFHYGLAGLRVKELASSRVGELSSSELEKLGLRLKKTEIREIPDHWEVVRLGEVYKITNKPANVDFKNFRLIPFIPMEEIGFGTVNPKYYMKPLDEISSGIYFERGDLLLAKITPSFENGKQSIVENIPLNFGIATTEVIPIKQTRKSNIYYLFYLLQETNVRSFLAESMEGTTGRRRLSKNVLLNFKIPLPPLPEQQEIAEILQTIDQKIEIEKKKKELYHELFKTLLNKIMNQEIDVNLLDY
jgi:type I restriction enzyme S subunit